VITPGDREDIILAAGAMTNRRARRKWRESSDRRFAPRTHVLKAIQAMPIPVLLVQPDSYEWLQR